MSFSTFAIHSTPTLLKFISLCTSCLSQHLISMFSFALSSLSHTKITFLFLSLLFLFFCWVVLFSVVGPLHLVLNFCVGIVGHFQCWLLGVRPFELVYISSKVLHSFGIKHWKRSVFKFKCIGLGISTVGTQHFRVKYPNDNWTQLSMNHYKR